MKWKTEYPEFYHQGQRRLRTVFALLPRQCRDGYTRWLCWVLQEEFYVRDVHSHGQWYATGDFYPVKDVTPGGSA